jgi:hypothetical protein
MNFPAPDLEPFAVEKEIIIANREGVCRRRNGFEPMRKQAQGKRGEPKTE